MQHERPITVRRLAFKSAPHCPRCQGEFCDLIRTLDPERDLHFHSLLSLSGGNSVVRAVEKGNERDRAHRIIRWVLTEDEAAKLDESGKLIRLRIAGKVDPFAYKTVPSKQVDAAKNEHRLGLAKLALAEESSLISEDEWATLIKTHAASGRGSGNKKERSIGPVPSKDEALVCIVCYHVYQLLDKVHMVLGEGGSNSNGEGDCTEDSGGAGGGRESNTEAQSPPPTRKRQKNQRSSKGSSKGIEESSHENCKPNVMSSTSRADKRRNGARSSKQRKPLHMMHGEKRPRILVADPDEESISAVTRNLKPNEYDVKTVSNGQECLEMLQSSSTFDVVLVAKDLVSKDAFEITKWIRCHHHSSNKEEQLPQIIILTSDVTPLDLRSYVSAGIDGCLRKPLEGDQLVTTVKDAVAFLAKRAEAAKNKAEAAKRKALAEAKQAKEIARKTPKSRVSRPRAKKMVDDGGLRTKKKEKKASNKSTKKGDAARNVRRLPASSAPPAQATRTAQHSPAPRKTPVKVKVKVKVPDNDDPNSFSGTFECDASTSLPYTILDSGYGSSQALSSATGATCPLFNLVVCHDVFDTLERMAIQLSALVVKYPGIQVLLWNYPGQGFTTFADATVLNNEFHSSCLDKLIHHVGPEGIKRFDASRPFFLMGHGNGGSIASCYAAKYRPPSLRGLVLVNSLSFVDPHYASVFHDCSNVFGCAPETRPDLPVYFFSRFIFSPSYLAKTSAPLALNLYTAVHNPITLRGRIQLCLGALNNIDTRPLLSDISAPIISIHGEQASLARPLHAKSYLDGRRASKSIHSALNGVGNRTCIVMVKGGHELFQEKKKHMLVLIEQLLTGYYEGNDGPNPLIPATVGEGRSGEDEGHASVGQQSAAATSPQPPMVRFEDKFIDSVLASSKRANATKDDDNKHLPSKAKSGNVAKFMTKSDPTPKNTLLFDPTNPSFERQGNAIYKAGGSSSIYPDPKQYPEVSEYMAWRLKRNRKRLLRLDHAARIIQNIFRVFMARTMLDRLKREKSALTIQRCYRGRRGRLCFLQRRKELWAALFVQRALRGHHGRCKSYRQRLQIESQTRLAKRWRGTRARKLVLALIARRNLAATYMQCLWRRYKAIKVAIYHRERRDASIVLERMYRGHLGRRRAEREREKYLFSRSQSSGIELGRQLLAEHKLHATRLQSEISLLDQEKRTAEERVDVLLEEISQFEEDVASLEKEMHVLTKAERENAAVLKGKLKHELRDQKIRLDKEFGVMLARIADRKTELKSLEKKLLDLGRHRQGKNEDMKSLERKLVVLLEAQETQIEAIRRRREDKHNEMAGGDGRSGGVGAGTGTARSNSNGIVEAGQGKIHQYQGPSIQEKQEAAELMTSTEQMMKFGFMSMSMTYFSSLNMVRAMKKVAVQDTVVATAAGAGTEAAGTALPRIGPSEVAANDQNLNSGYGSANSSSHVRDWSVDDVLKWLSAISLDLYIDSFREGAVDGNFLCKLTDDDLRSTLGVEHKLHRKKILCGIDELITPPQGVGDHVLPTSPALHLPSPALTSAAPAVAEQADTTAMSHAGTLEDYSIAPTALNESFHEGASSPLAPAISAPPFGRSQSMMSPASSVDRRHNIEPRRQTAPNFIDPRNVPLYEMEPGQSSRRNFFASVGGGISGMVPPTFDELATRVRNKKDDLIREALEIIPTKPFDERCTRVQFADDVGTAYVESYESEVFNLNKCDEHGNTLLHVAAQNGNVRIAKLLLSKGANPNHQNKEGQTPGHFALAYQFYDFASWLFDANGGKANDTLTNVHGLGPYDGLGREGDD